MANGIFAESQQTSTFLVWPWNITISTASIVWSALLFLFQLYYDYYYYFCNAHFSPPLGAYRVRCASEESNLFGVIVTRSHWDSSHRSSRGDEQHKITVSFFFLFFFIDIHGPSSIARIDVCVCVCIQWCECEEWWWLFMEKRSFVFGKTTFDEIITFLCIVH